MTNTYNSNLAQFEKLVATIPNLERKGKTMPYTSVNGHMFSFLDKEGQLSIRLPEDVRNAFIAQYNTALSIQHGRVMKEYTLVPEKLLHDIQALASFFLASHAYTSSLKPKPSKKK